MANEEVSNIGVKLSLDASNFSAGLGTAQGKLNSFQQQAAKAASGAGAAKAGAGSTPTTIKVAIEPAQLQAALSTAAKTLQTIHVPIDVDSRSISTARQKIIAGIGTIPVQIAAQFPKSGPGSPQAIIGTVFSSMGGMSPQKGQLLARQAIDQIMPKREHGGPVQQGRPTIVGERRPEVFRPGASGFIEKDVAQYRRHAAELAALEYQIMQRQKNVQHALRGARTAMLPPGVAMPMPLGTAPLREGYVRGYHSTKGTRSGSASENLASIRAHGLKLSQGLGHTYGEPDMNWFSSNVQGYDERSSVEAHLPAHWFNSSRSRRWTNPPTMGGPSSNMAVGRDISRRRFASFNEPWMHSTRYMQDAVGRTRSKSPGAVMRQIGPTMATLRGQGGYEKETQGYDQFVAESWRARHRGYGGEVYGLYGGSAEALEEAAIKHYGVTDDVREAGFITPSGKFLDFSGRHEAEGYVRQGDRFVTRRDPVRGTTGKDYLAGQRSLDHRESNQILPGISQGDSVERMKQMGFIRVWGTTVGHMGKDLHSVGAEMTRLPTSAQISKLVGAARESLHASVDVYDPMGYQLPGGNFRTEWPDDPMGGKRMGSFLRQAMELIEQNDSEADEIRQSLGMHRCVGGAVHASKGCVHAMAGNKEARAYGDWALSYHQQMMGGKGKPSISDTELSMIGRGNTVLDALSSIGQDRAVTGTHRAFYDIERLKIEAEAAKLQGVSGRQLVDVVAAVSSNQPWDRNVEAGVQAIMSVQGTGPGGFANRDQLDLVQRILHGERVTGVKRLPFAEAFYDPNAFPIDRWMGRITTLGMKTGIPAPTSVMDIMEALRGKDWIAADSPQPSVRRASAYTVEQLAKRRGLDPREAQAEPWGTVRDLNKEAVKFFRFDTKTGKAVPRAAGGSVVPHAGFLDEVALTAVGWANDPFMAMMAWQASQAKQQHRAKGGLVLPELRTMAAYKRFVAQRANEPLFTRWSPDITKDMLPGARSKHLEYPWHGDIEKGISAMPATQEAARLLGLIPPDNPDVALYRSGVHDDELGAWQHGLSGAYDLGPARGNWDYREDQLEGYRKRNLYLMRGHPVGRGFDEEPVLDPESIQPLAKIRRRAVEAAHNQWMRERGFASGGPMGKGMYIVNEQGDRSEGFVAGKDAHLIPKFVMDRIPGARDGAKTGMINKPANSFFSPEQDGIIIPKWAVPYVGALRHAQAGATNVEGVAIPPGYDPNQIATIRTFAKGQGSTPEALASQFGLKTWAEHTAEMTREIHSVARRDIQIQRPSVARELQEGRAGLGKELPSRTVQGAVASVSSFLFGGVQQLGQAQVRYAHAQQDYNRAQSNTNRLVSKSAGVMTSYREALSNTNLSAEERTAIEQDRSAYIAKQKPILQAAVAAEKDQTRALKEADAKARPTNAGIVKNIGVIIAATSGYGLAMQAASAVIQPALEGSIRAVQDFGDQLSGFSATGSRVTKGLGEQLNQTGGNLTKTFSDVGLQTRMSAGFTAFLEKTLGGSVVAKAAAANQGQVSELFRASLSAGNGSSGSGLYGGYGGVFGSPLLASELGGGKGFMEQIAGDISAYSGQRGPDLGASLSKGIQLATDTNFRNYVTGQAKEQGNPLGAVSDVVGGLGDVIRNLDLVHNMTGLPTPFSVLLPGKTPTPADNPTGKYVNPALLGKSGPDQAGITHYLANMGDEARRGAQAMGEQTKYTYKLAKSQEQLDAGTRAAAASGDVFATSMATNGVILVDATGKVAQAASDFEKVAQQMAKGATVPDPMLFAQSQAQSFRASLEVLAAQTAQQLGVGIPGQMGMELAAHPFLPAAAGVLPPGVSAGQIGSAPGGIDIAKTLADTQAVQDDLTKQGAAALKALSSWIGQQPGMQGPYTVGGFTTNQMPSAPAVQGVQYSAPIGPGASGAPLPSTSLLGGMAAPTSIGGQTFKSGQAAFDYFTGQMADAGKAIAGWQTKIVNTQTAQQWAQFSNNLRLANRSYADALALAGRGGGGRGSNGEMGGLERQQTMLGFMLSQKQINFQTALAGFQAPGLTSEERGARQAQAEAEARIAQKQLNIQERMFTVGASRGVTDTGAAVKLIKSEQAAQVAIAAAQKAIAAQQMKLSQAQSKAQAVLQQAEGGFTGALGQAGQFAAQFGGAVQTAVKVIYTSLGFKQTRGGGWYQANPLPQVGQTQNQGPRAAGYLGTFARGAVMTVGEAGPETVAILRNPRTHMMGFGGGGGGGGGPVSVTLNLTVQGDVSGDATIAKIVRAVEDSFNRKAARLGMRGLVSATG